MKKIWRKPHMMTMNAQQLAAHIRAAAWSEEDCRRMDFRSINY